MRRRTTVRARKQAGLLSLVRKFPRLSRGHIDMTDARAHRRKSRKPLSVWGFAIAAARQAEGPDCVGAFGACRHRTFYRATTPLRVSLSLCRLADTNPSLNGLGIRRQFS